MAFDFGNHMRREYKNTFLQNVLVEIDFKEWNLIDREDVSRKWNEFVVSNFNNSNETNLSVDLLEKPIRVSRKDGFCSFFFSRSVVSAVVGAKDYRTFVDSVIPQIYKLSKFLTDVISINEVTRLSLRKINIWQFKSKDTSPIQSEEVRKILFSNALITHEESEVLNEEERNIGDMHKYEWEDGDKKAIVKTFFISPKQTGVFAQILDSELQMTKSIQIDQVQDNFIELNNILYNLYHWCVSESVIDIMIGNQK
ncbi:MAG: TIGR04255 family protein [Paludibacteraceae bacterium]|nr:TIGR04255 family protein [Paludibacteraceae bacterium]